MVGSLARELALKVDVCEASGEDDVIGGDEGKVPLHVEVKLNEYL